MSTPADRARELAEVEAAIRGLDKPTVVQVFKAITDSRKAREHGAELPSDAAFVTELVTASGVPPESGDTEDADLARAGLLLLLRDDPALAPEMSHAIQRAGGKYSLAALALGAAALVALQSHIEFSYVDGKWTFKFKKDPLSDELLKAVIAKLGGWMRLG